MFEGGLERIQDYVKYNGREQGDKTKGRDLRWNEA